MMKMDGRDSAECQNWEKKDINVIFGIVLNELKDKIPNSGCLLQKEAKIKRGEEEKKEGDAVAVLGVFRVRRLDFSLESWEIRPSAVFGLRRKAALRGESNA